MELESEAAHRGRVFLLESRTQCLLLSKCAQTVQIACHPTRNEFSITCTTASTQLTAVVDVQLSGHVTSLHVPTYIHMRYPMTGSDWPRPPATLVDHWLNSEAVAWLHNSYSLVLCREYDKVTDNWDSL